MISAIQTETMQATIAGPTANASTITTAVLSYPPTDDLCVFYRHEDTIWFKRGENSSHQLFVFQPQKYNLSACPPSSLLPQDKTPHLCFQHPNRHEIWFNTEQQKDYGKHYNSDLWRYDPNSQVVESILLNEQGGQYIQFSPDGQYLILSTNKEIKLMRSDENVPRKLFDFPELSVCSEVNVWAEPIWLPDSSGVIVRIRDGCLNSKLVWPFGLWWASINGRTALIDSFRESNDPVLNTMPERRTIDTTRYVYWDSDTVYLGQTDMKPFPLIQSVAAPNGYAVFLCSELATVN